jgi:hypothetical protein
MIGDDNLPVLVTNILSLSFIPFLILNPLFKILGLAQNHEWVGIMPSMGGIILGMLIYSVIFYGLGKFIQIIFQKK